MQRLIYGKLKFLNYNLITALLSVAIAFIAMVIPDTIFSFLFKEDSSYFYGYDDLVKYALIIFTAVILSSLILRSFKSENLGFEFKNIISVVIWSISVFVIFNLIVFLAQKFDPRLSSSSKLVIESLGFGKSNKRDIIMFSTVCFMAPIWEEVIYRGLAYRAVRDALHSKWAGIISYIVAIAISSYLFMSAHGGEGQSAQLIYLFILGALLTLSYLYTGTLITPILAHSFNNTYVLWKAFSESGKTIAGLSSNFILLGPLFALIIFTFIWAIYNLFKLKTQ